MSIQGEIREEGRTLVSGRGVDHSIGGIGHLFARYRSIPEMLANSHLRSLGPMGEDAERQVDQRVIRVALERLVVVQDMMRLGLTFPLSDPIGTPILSWDQISQMDSAFRSMIPGQGEDQLPERPRLSVPIYATWSTSSLDIRTLRASQRSGSPLDLEFVSTMTRSVNERIEDAAINGAGLTVKSNATPGLINAPNVNTMVYGGGTAWDDAAKTGVQILADVKEMIIKLQAKNYFGPYILWIPSTYGIKIAVTQYTADFPMTIKSMLQTVDTGSGPLVINTADQLPTDRTVMAQMTSDVLDIIDGQQPMAISWTSPDGWRVFITVLAFEVPRTRDTFENQSGIVTGFTS